MVLCRKIGIREGEHELILGDRQTGKTTIAIDTILNQHDQDVVCVYCAIGQRAAAVAKAVADIPAPICERLESAEKLNDEDRKTIIEIARQALARFQSGPQMQTAVKPN